MLPKTNRLSRKELLRVNKLKPSVYTKYFVAVLTKDKASGLKIGINISNKISKSAVYRNKIRRLTMSAAKAYKDINATIYIIVKTKIPEESIKIFIDDVEKTLNKVKLLK